MDSILNTVKKMLNINAEDTFYDMDLTILINGAIDRLKELGYQYDSEFVITGDEETWDQFIGNDNRKNSIIEYIYLKTRMGFNPPQGSSMLESCKSRLDELEYILYVRENYTKPTGESQLP